MLQLNSQSANWSHQFPNTKRLVTLDQYGSETALGTWGAFDNGSNLHILISVNIQKKVSSVMPIATQANHCRQMFQSIDIQL